MEFSLNTEYKKENMRSRLEARTAYLLDCLNMGWEYEEHEVLLSDGMLYVPDFHLPEQNIWMECKGNLEDSSVKKAKRLAKDKEEEIIILSQDNGYFMTQYPGGMNVGGAINLVKCSSCGKYSFVPNLAGWSCRNCGFHNGDHDIVCYDIFSGFPKLRLSSTDKIDIFIDNLS